LRDAKEESTFLDALLMMFAVEADSTPLTPEQMRLVDRLHLLKLDPRTRLDRRDDQH
jgi:hypothetical protein